MVNGQINPPRQPGFSSPGEQAAGGDVHAHHRLRNIALRGQAALQIGGEQVGLSGTRADVGGLAQAPQAPAQGGGAADARGQGQHRRQRPRAAAQGCSQVLPRRGEQVGEGHRQHHTPGKAEGDRQQLFTPSPGGKDHQRPQQGGQPGGQGQQQRADSGGFQHSSIPRFLVWYSYYSTQAGI